MTDRSTVRPPLPGAPTVAGPAADPPAAAELPLVAAVARGVALVVVLPVRLLWELIAATGRLLYRYLLGPTGRFLRRWLLAPLAWALHRLLWVPLVWVARTFVWLPLVWLGHVMAWVARVVLRPPLVLFGRALVWLVEHLVVRPLRWLGTVLAPAGRLVVAAVVGAWRVAGWLLRLLYRPLLRGLRWAWSAIVVPVARGVGAAWRATVSPVARWIRRSVLDPARLASREVLTALGLRR
ncbi:hypothetical protein [Micromonospora sp. NBC_00858]|uniref:hypothetical protein n=1 Tax=Micromonospora sp. NBC_00858 TaxID=2975979 RepID=UPI00386CF62D|nr:hypothetical protein OG990_20665 [Micromonospora sp. NBC_00858]